MAGNVRLVDSGSPQSGVFTGRWRHSLDTPNVMLARPYKEGDKNSIAIINFSISALHWHQRSFKFNSFHIIIFSKIISFT